MWTFSFISKLVIPNLEWVKGVIRVMLWCHFARSFLHLIKLPVPLLVLKKEDICGK